MGKVIPFPSKGAEQEVIYFELLPKRDFQLLINMKRFSDKGLIESELTVLAIN